MNNLRAISRMALTAGLLAGLAGCGKQKGDLGAAGHQTPVVKKAPAAEVVDLGAVKPAPAQPPVRTVAPVATVQPKFTPKSPTPAPANETKEERAKRLLEEAQRNSSVKTQADLQASDAAFQTGLRMMNDLEYEEAKKYFEEALARDPANTEAANKLRSVNGLLGIKADRLGTKIRELEQIERVRVQEAMLALGLAVEEARQFEEKGTGAALANDPAEKEKTLSEQLEFLRQAQDRFRRVKEIINWMPPSVELPSQKAQVDQSLTRLRGMIAEKEEEINYLRRAAALRITDQNRARDTELFKSRVKKLLEQVKDFYNRKEYRAAEAMAKRILTLDPLNEDAQGWKNRARNAAHAKETATSDESGKRELKRSWQDVEEATIAYAPLSVYPPDWETITRRRTETSTIGHHNRDQAWKQDIKKKIQKKVTFEFVDTPLKDAVDFLRQVSGVTMILDPKATGNGETPINLRVNDMTVELALDWILRLAELDSAIQDNAIFISKADKLQESVELRIYDVSDLTSAIQDFPGPDFQITTAGDASGNQGQQNPFLQAPKAAPTPTNIAEMIRARVRPDAWDQALGTSIEERGGKLVVMQRADVHSLIDQLLSNFRATQKMMINIESRFLKIREAYLEDIGVEYQGLDPNVLFGDFGDIRRLSSPNQFHQPRQPGATDGNPPNAPFPGFVNGPDRVLGGTFSEVGSLINHTINFFGNDTDTISGKDQANVINQGGFSGQLSIINNTQLQAFFRALAIRENESTLIAPRLTVFNTQRAHMFVARQQSYVADYEISGDSYDPIIRQFLVGVVLDVKPIVSSDRRYVTLEMRPTVTDLVSFTTRQIDAFTVNSGANVTVIIPLSFPIQFPELSIQRVRTTATVPDGGILLIGGLYRNVKFNAENGVPFLSDLPVIGRLFRWNTVDNARSNLAILVSPRIIIFSEEEERL